MTKDKKVLYVISFFIFAVLFAALFVNVGSSKIVAACLLAPLTAATVLLVKKRRAFSINKKEVLLLCGIVAVLYVVLYQITGIFLQFYKNPYFVNPNLLLSTILPLAVIIISSEMIRTVLLAQNDKLVSLLAYVCCVLAEILAFSNLEGITSFNRFMDLVGLTLFPAVTANAYYHFVSKRYGALPNIVFRLITTLYVYFIPITTGISDALTACVKIFLPIVMLVLISAMFEKKKKPAVKKSGTLSKICAMISVVIILSVSMLISCHFRYGAIVIATESMTGEINKGDMIIYEQYDNQVIREGQVIVFQQQNNRIIHRVVKIETIGNEVRYYTKGDFNEDMDAGYRTKADIVGLTNVKIPYVGHPTLWLRDLLENR